MTESNLSSADMVRFFRKMRPVLLELLSDSRPSAGDSSSGSWENLAPLWRRLSLPITVKVKVPWSDREDLIQEVLRRMIYGRRWISAYSHRRSAPPR